MYDLLPNHMSSGHCNHLRPRLGMASDSPKESCSARRGGWRAAQVAFK